MDLVKTDPVTGKTVFPPSRGEISVSADPQTAGVSGVDSNFIKPVPLKIPAGDTKTVAVVCPPVFQEALSSWLEYRQKQGYSFIMISTADLDGAVHGDNNELTLRISRSLNAVNRKTPLSAVLLVGDAWPAPETKDDWSRIVPSPRIAAQVIDRFGNEKHIASDSWYTDFDGNGFPDAAVGRFPVRSPEELIALTEKIVRYEERIPAGQWQRKIHFVAGIGDLGAIADQVINSVVRKIVAGMIPDEYVSTFTQANWKSPFCPAPSLFRDVVISRLNEGALFWVYMGHGWYQGLDVLHTPDNNFPILEYNDAKLLRCSQAPPIVFFSACYTGTIDGWGESLAERMALETEGPVAVIAASRVSMPYGLAVFSTELLSAMFDPKNSDRREGQTLGSVILRAKQRMRPIPNPEKISSNGQENGSKRSGSSADSGQNEDLTGIKGDAGHKQEIRDFLDQMGSLLDPTGHELDKQLLDHVHSINLLGDPLLRIRFPEKMELSAPETVPAAHIMEISGRYDPKDPGEFKICAELSLPRQRSGIRRSNRKEFSLSSQEQEEYQKTYMAANDLVLARSEGKATGGKFYIELKVPDDCFGVYVLRVVAEKENRMITGAQTVRIRSFDPDLPRPSAHSYSGKLYHYDKKETGGDPEAK